MNLRRTGTSLGKGRSFLQVAAVQSPRSPKGRTPPGGEPDRIDPFDRHSSARDKLNAQNQTVRANAPKGASFSTGNRRRGRPAHLRSPDDSPLRDGNRDRLVGLLTERAVKTLLVYLQETNPTVFHWLFCYYKDNPIPLTGTWDEIAGEMFLRKLLSLPSATAKMDLGRDELFDNIKSTGVDPRQLAQRVMEIRVQLSKEFIQDLGLLAEENSVLLRETLQVSLNIALEQEPIQQLPPRDTSKVFVHPELLLQGGVLHPEIAASHPELLPVVKDQAAKAKANSQSPPPAPITTSSTPVQPPQSTPAQAQLNLEKDSPPPRPVPGPTKPLPGLTQPKWPRIKPWSPKDVPGIGPP